MACGDEIRSEVRRFVHFRSIFVDRTHQTIHKRHRILAKLLRFIVWLQQCEVRSQMRGRDVDFVVCEMFLPVQTSLQNLATQRCELIGRLQIAIDRENELRSGLADLLVLIEEESETMRERIDRKQGRDGQSGLCRIKFRMIFVPNNRRMCREPAANP